MKIRFKRRICLFMAILLTMGLCFAACSKTADAAGGTYYFVWEKLSTITNTTYDYKFVLDGFGGGEYHHKGSVHKIKYEYQSNGDINIKDTITGIKYNGTLINGELHLYDGNPDSLTVSEFLYRKQ